MNTTPSLTQALSRLQNGPLAQAIAEVCSERDRLRKENAILQEANRGLAEEGERLRVQVDALRVDCALYEKEQKEFLIQRDEALVQCAEMREALEWVHMGSLCADPATAASSRKDCPICAALATEAGKGFVPADKARVIADCLEECAYELGLVHEMTPFRYTERGRVLNSHYEALATAREIGVLSKNPS